jgi:hydrogenase maturation factor
MSVAPKSKLPVCTRTAVLDLLFMRKYKLTKTEMIVLYYFLLLKTWVKYVEGEFYVILSSKIEKDLKLHTKTVEASITKLKKLNLIETKRMKVKEWHDTKTYRGIAITPLGKEYNLSHYKEKDYQHAIELEKENEQFRVENCEVHSINMQLESKNNDLKLRLEALTLQLEADGKLNKASIEALEKSRRLEEKNLALEMETKELKAKILEMQQNQKTTPEEEKEKKEKEKDKNIEIFRKKIITQFARSGKAICNAVQNHDSWAIETKFYINSYNRLSIYTSNGKMKQIADPKQISNFWEWLFEHQHRVGDLLDEKSVADISSIILFIGALVIINKIPYRINGFEPVKGGVKLTLINNQGDYVILRNGHGADVLDVTRCKEWLELNAQIE